MQPHQERVVAEKTELDDKLTKLKSFEAGPIYRSLPEDEQKRLSSQADVMQQYSDILGQRIAAFPK